RGFADIDLFPVLYIFFFKVTPESIEAERVHKREQVRAAIREANLVRLFDRLRRTMRKKRDEAEAKIEPLDKDIVDSAESKHLDKRMPDDQTNGKKTDDKQHQKMHRVHNPTSNDRVVIQHHVNKILSKRYPTCSNPEPVLEHVLNKVNSGICHYN